MHHHHHHHHPPPTTTTTTTSSAITTPYILLVTTLFFLLLLLSFTISPNPPPPTQRHPSLFPHHQRILFHNPNTTKNRNTAAATPPLPPLPPSIAYFISGSGNDSDRILRLLYSIYHPWNQYLLNLDQSAPQADRDNLALRVQSVPVFKAAQNVHIIGKADYIYPTGPSSLSSTLHGASILLRVSANWDWFINLSANDYPLVTQDDLLHILSYLPKDLNFVNHTSYIGWRESRKLKPIIVDPALYLVESSETFYATEKRKLPDAFRLFTGSSSAILTRKLVEFCILGTDNFPRTLLMYLSNTPASNLVYFPTILCNTRRFNRTTINHNLQYVSYDSRQEPQPLNSSTFNNLIQSGAGFASPFHPDDPVLDRIDREILERQPGKPLPGGWCLGESEKDKCQVWGDADVLRPGPGARRLEKRMVELLSSENIRSRQCVDE